MNPREGATAYRERMTCAADPRSKAPPMNLIRVTLLCATLACRRDRAAPPTPARAPARAPATAHAPATPSTPDASTCSTAGAPCCAGDLCGGRFNCVAGVCQPCGERPLPCCAHAVTPCRNGVCIGGLCAVPPRTCGHHDQPCCEGQCGGSYRCVENVCRPRDADCGEQGQPCCPEEHRDDCGRHLHCTAGVCLPSTCGHENMPCCQRAERCGPRFTCIDNVCRVRQ